MNTDLITYIVGGLLLFALVFYLMREFALWYTGMKELIELQRENNQLLKEFLGKAEPIAHPEPEDEEF